MPLRISLELFSTAKNVSSLHALFPFQVDVLPLLFSIFHAALSFDAIDTVNIWEIFICGTDVVKIRRRDFYVYTF
jgi:hypothetical protein